MGQINKSKTQTTKIMSEAFEILAVFGSIFIGTVAIIRSFTSYKLKKRIIEGGANIDPNALELLKSEEDNPAKNTTLKWGLVVLFAGLGLIVIETLGYELSDNSTLPFGIELVFVSVGFLVYTFLMRNKR